MATFNSFQIDFTGFATSDVIQTWQSDNTQISTAFAAENLQVVWGIDVNTVDTGFVAERIPLDGSLMPGPESSPKYTMRAFNTGLSRYVYWDVPEPDPTGQFSGYSVSLLTDIVIFEEICTENTHNG